MKKLDSIEKPLSIVFDKINYDDIIEMEEFVTALLGTKQCCDKGGNIL